MSDIGTSNKTMVRVLGIIMARLVITALGFLGFECIVRGPHGYHRLWLAISLTNGFCASTGFWPPYDGRTKTLIANGGEEPFWSLDLPDGVCSLAF